MTFSFWRQLGRTTRGRGYTIGRELREGCLVPNRGGGLCQVTGLLYQAVLEAGLEIVERHEHSRLVPGSMGERDLDATVFWNYVDLRFRATFQWRLEVELDALFSVLFGNDDCRRRGRLGRRPFWRVTVNLQSTIGGSFHRSVVIL